MQSTIPYTLRDGIAVVTLDLPGEKVNILTSDFLRGLEETAALLAAEEGVRGAVVLSAKEAGFIAGADIEAIASVQTPEVGTHLAQRGQRVITLWSQLPFPVVAAINGHCIGGGTEFALACSARISSPDAHFSLPEVNLGIFPGFGGTQRLPRLIGLESALDLILSGRTVGAQEALRIGLVDRIASGDLLGEALALAHQLTGSPEWLSGQKRSGGKVLRRFLLEDNPLGRAVLFRQARARVVARTKGHYPAPLKALEVMRRGMALSLEEGLELEVQEIGPLLASRVCKNLVHVFSLSQRAKKEFSSGSKGVRVRRAAILGAGVMGSGISHLLISRDIPVVLRDIRQDALENALTEVRRLLKGKQKKLHADGDRKMQLITGTTQLWGIEEADVVIEAVAERMSVKKAVLQETVAHMSDGAIFATNTSALSVSELQKGAERPEMVGGLHFFNPVHRMPLVEVVRGEQTSERTIETLTSLVLKLGKIPVQVRDSPGFLVNRLLGVYLNEAALLVEEGIDWKGLDRLMEEFGFPVGPFRLLDEVGIDIASEVAVTLGAAFPYLHLSSLLERTKVQGRMGKKDEAGFYLYRKGRCIGPNPQTESLVSSSSRRPGVRDRKRLLYLMVNEAGRCLQEGIVSSPEDVDTGMIFGAGFPPFRGGLCRWADRNGLEEIREGLLEMAKGKRARFTPCEYLQREYFYR
jgi:3-hydroxyacyl-CoA dehydrogenase / enoyl-CoA hydratase / 3-hydroxybutyryl-CoA epimerase